MIILALFSFQIDHIISQTGADIYGAFDHSIPYVVITVIDTNINPSVKDWIENSDAFLIDTSYAKIRFTINAENKIMLDTMFSIMDSLNYYPSFITIVGDIDEDYLTSRTFFYKHKRDSIANYTEENGHESPSIEYTDEKDSNTEIVIDAPLPHLNSEDYLPLILGLKWLDYNGTEIGGWRGILKVIILPTEGITRLKISCRPGRERRIWTKILRFIGDTINFSGIDRIKNSIYGEFGTIFTSLYGISDIIILADTQCADPGLFYQNIKMYLNAITPKDVGESMSKFIHKKKGWKIWMEGNLNRINERFFMEAK